MPFNPGICTSTMTHEGPGYAKRDKNSEADLKSSVSCSAASSKRLRPFRIDSSSSITNTLPVEVINIALARYWQTKTKMCSASVGVFGYNASAMGLNNRAHNGKTHSEAFLLRSEELLKEPFTCCL